MAVCRRMKPRRTPTGCGKSIATTRTCTKPAVTKHGRLLKNKGGHFPRKHPSLGYTQWRSKRGLKVCLELRVKKVRVAAVRHVRRLFVVLAREEVRVAELDFGSHVDLVSEEPID